jgi:hypothetical protein
VDLDTKMVSAFVRCDTMMEGLAMIPTLVDAVKGAGFEAEFSRVLSSPEF